MSALAVETAAPEEAREAVLRALLARVPREGWTRAALSHAGADAGLDAAAAGELFPGGVRDALDGFAALADRWMLEDAAADGLAGLRTAGRVRAVILLRLARLAPHRDALRRALALAVLPPFAATAARATARTVDAIWHAAGEPLADAARHTKRATLAGVWTSTLLVWLRDESADLAATRAFLDRRLADVGRIGKLRARLGNIAACRPSTA